MGEDILMEEKRYKNILDLLVFFRNKIEELQRDILLLNKVIHKQLKLLKK